MMMMMGPLVGNSLAFLMLVYNIKLCISGRKVVCTLQLVLSSYTPPRHIRHLALVDFICHLIDAFKDILKCAVQFHRYTSGSHFENRVEVPVHCGQLFPRVENMPGFLIRLHFRLRG